MGLIRMYERNAVHFVTNRCEHEMFFLKPTPQVNRLILFWLTKAKTKFGSSIEIYAFCFMSNHFHILLRDPEGQLPEFMGYFQGNLAKAVNRELGRHGTFWSREYDDIIVDGEGRVDNRFVYIALNPVAAGLVDCWEEWGGVSSMEYSLTGNAVEGFGTNVTRYHDKKRFNPDTDEAEFAERFYFELTPLPYLQGESSETIKAYITALVQNGMVDIRNIRKDKPSVGMKDVLLESPLKSPQTPKRKPRFKVMCDSQERLRELKETYRTFVDSYRSCLRQLNLLYDKNAGQPVRSVSKVQWPLGSYPPTFHRPVEIALA